MKRILYILAFIFFGLFGVVNDVWSVVIYSETFGTTGNKTDWSVYDGWSNSKTPVITTTTAWRISPNTTETCNVIGTSGNCNVYSGTSGATLIFNFGNISTYNNVILSFNYYNNRAGGNERTITCQISGDGGKNWSSNILASNTTNGWCSSTVVYNILSTYTSNFSVKFTNTAGNISRIDDIILTGEGEAPKYTVTFNNCDITEEQTQENTGDAISFSNAQCSNECKLNGWKFLGWFTSNENHNTKVTSPITPISDTTLYAWYTLGENNCIIDTLTYDKIGLGYEGSNVTYTNFSNIEISSGSLYSGQIARFPTTQTSNKYIQMRETRPSGIINVTSPGYLSHLTIKWNDATSNTRSLKIYTSDTVYHSSDDLHNRAKCLDSISKSITDLDLDGSKYIGLRSKTGAIYIDTIYITWKNGDDIQYSTNPKCFSTPITVTEWFENSVEFDINGKDSLYNEPFVECDSIRMLVTNATNDTCIRWFHVPIFADDDMDVDPNCDVVVLNGKTFTPQNNAQSKGVYIYPGGTLIVNGTYTADSLVLRRDNDNVPYFKYNGILNTDKLYFELRTDGEDWRWLTLPDTLKSSIINGKDEAIIKYYNDSIRAINGKNAWVDEYPIYKKEYLPGQGCIFGVDDDHKHIYSFKLNTNVLSYEDMVKEVLVHAYKNPIAPPNDLGWNVVGNPFMDECYISSNNPIRVGQLIHNDSDPWNGGWTISDTIEQKLKYIVEYQNGEYIAIPLTKNGIKLKPYTSFFVQIDTTGSENKVLKFTKDTENYGRAPQRTKQISEETFLQLNVNNKQTGCFITNKYNDEYEINADLESFDNQLYQTINGYKLIYSAINDSIIEHGINVFGYGEVSLNDITDINSFEEINIFYSNHYYDLLNGDTANVQGNFILFARRNKNDIPTGLNETIINNGVKKFIHNSYIYVVRDNETYSILGEKIR